MAGLRHVDPDTLAGLTRVASGEGFAYVDARGRRVTSARTLHRIESLVLPPAWTRVWICPTETGHIQAIGFDARGRKQYRYHAHWREVRDAAKFHKMLAFSHALPRIREACKRDLAKDGLKREKVLAVAVRLLETTHMRVGNEEYARENGSFGLTTLRDRHVRIVGDDVRFHYRGKSGKVRDVGVHDHRLARIITKCSELPGHELFQYVDGKGKRHSIGSADVNAYIGRIAGHEFTAKDFRTWAGTVLAAQALRAAAPCLAQARGKKDVSACIKTVAAHLGNTPAVCRKSYVHPAVVESYLEGAIGRIRARSDERLVHAIITRAAREEKLNRKTRRGEAVSF